MFTRLAATLLAATLSAPLLAATLSAPLLAADEPDEVFEYREKAMELSSLHLKSLSALLQGKVTLPEQALIHSAALKGLMGNIPAMFPPGSDFAADTSAKAEVWENPDAFELAADKANLAASLLHEALERADSAKAREHIRSLGRACKGCHEEFRNRD